MMKNFSFSFFSLLLSFSHEKVLCTGQGARSLEYKIRWICALAKSFFFSGPLLLLQKGKSGVGH